MDAQPHTPSQPSAAAQPIGRAAAQSALRMARLILVTVIGFALLLFGIISLVTGITDHRPVSAAAGTLALSILIIAITYAILKSRRQVRAAVEEFHAKLRAGFRACPSCRIDFADATAPRTPKPWHHTAILIVLALIPLVAGALVLWAMGTSNSESIKAGFLLVFGVGALAYSSKSSRNLYVRCPKCGRICGSVDASTVSNIR